MNPNVEMLNETLRIEKDGLFFYGGKKVYLKLNANQTREATYISAEKANTIRENSQCDGSIKIGRCGYSVINKDSFEAAHEIIEDYRFKTTMHKRVLVLNFANSINPGGGARNGAKAQEEDLCRKSTLLVSLENAKVREFYATHKENYSNLASDSMILSPDVEVIRDAQGNLLENTYVVSVLTCAAPNIKKGIGALMQGEYEALLYNRIMCMLQVAVFFEYKYLVLGAWGCGAFGNDAKVVAKLFYKALKDIHCGMLYENSLFDRIVFAVLDNTKELYNLNAFKKYFDDFYRSENEEEKQRVEKLKKEKERYLSKILGCMVGGAAGDALGYAVEFESYEQIIRKYGCNGITQYDLNKDGVACVSDDTQMSLFTANGILTGDTRYKLRGIGGPIEVYVNDAYLDWLITQTGENQFGCKRTWLLQIPELNVRRAPGNTCMAALHYGGKGSIDTPINDSKGCGGIMRIAPIALYRVDSEVPYEQVAYEGAKLAALTHGHPLGYMASAVLAYILRSLMCESDVELYRIINASKVMLQNKFKDNPYLEELEAIIDKAVELSQNTASDIDNIKKLGEGWVAEETLAIALYCSLKYQNDFSAGVIASVNHSGDSDSTGAVTGNILGALVGVEAIDGKWKRNLELYEVIEEMSMDLCHGCCMAEMSYYEDEAWQKKYVFNECPEKYLLKK